MKLPGPVEAKLITAIADAFTVDEFTMFLAFHLDRDFDELASPSKIPTQWRHCVPKSPSWHS